MRLLARLALCARRRGGAAAGVEHGVDELEDGALIGGRELFDALEARVGGHCVAPRPSTRPIRERSTRISAPGGDIAVFTDGTAGKLVASYFGSARGHGASTPRPGAALALAQ